MNLKKFKEKVDQFANVLIDKDNSNIFISAGALNSAFGQWFIAFSPVKPNFKVQTNWEMLNDSIDYNNLDTLFDLIDKLRMTPVEKRGISQKKYYLKVTHHYNGTVPKTYYVIDFECSDDYTKIIYGFDPRQFTEMELQSIKRQDPALEEFIDSHKELVKEKD